MTVMLHAGKQACQEAGQRLASGALVAFPTETVYGLGGNALNSQAVAGIFDAKGRPSFNPLIVHVPDPIAAEQYADFNDLARDLAQAFWPGPLTLVLPRKADGGISHLVSAGLDTVAIRVPAHPVALDILRAAKCPIAAPSANPSGRVSPTTAAHVFEGLQGRIDMVIDGGSCAVGIESTVLDVTGETLRVLRPGGVTADQIARVTGLPVIEDEVVVDGQSSHSPGTMVSHYAPNAYVRLNASDRQDGEVLLGFGDVADATLNLSPSGDLKEAAANVFSMLRKLDVMDCEGIAISPIPEHGLGRAINDRLRRAAAPRPDAAT